MYNHFPSKIFPGDSLTYIVGALIGIIAVVANLEKAFLVLFTESSAIVDAILLKKRIVSFYSSYMDENMIKHTENYAENIGTVKINIEDEITFNKDDFLLKLDKAKEKYLNFIESRIVPDGNNLGYEKIIKTLKERFFY